MSRTQPPCKIEWLEIPAPDLATAREFYASLFGWAIESYSPDYAVFRSGTLQGGLSRGLQPNGQGIGFSITVDDIEAMLARIVATGGNIIREKYHLGGDLGYCARFEDPNGNQIELWSPE